MAQVKDLLVKGQAKFLRKAYFQDQIVSNVAQGTAPLVVASSTVVSNLNSDYLDGYHASGLFTALSANSTLSITIGGTTLTSSINAATVDGKYISNYYTKSEADNRFVNVAGDTMSGHLTIKTASYKDQLTIYRNENNNNSVINFSNKDGFLGAIGFTGLGQTGMAEKPHIVLKDSSLHVLLHDGNYTDYTVTKTGTGATGTWGINISGNASTSNRTKFLETFQKNSTTNTYGEQYPIWAQWSDNTNVRLKCTNYTVWTDKATTATNADKLDGYHASDLVKFYLSPMTGGAPADSATSWFVNTMPAGTGAIVYNVPGSEKTIIAGKSTGAYGHMLQLNYDDNYLRILRYYAGKWKTSDWEKISAGYADSAGSVAWSGVTGKPSTFAPSPHEHSYLPLSGGTMTLGEGLKFHADENYFGTNLDARIISLLDGNGTTCDGGLIIDERATSNGVETVTELLRIRHDQFTWKGNTILTSGNYTSYLGYIGTTAVQANSAAQALSGITSINSRLSINAESDNTRLGFGGVHGVTFGEPGYAHRIYYFRPAYGSNGVTYTSLIIQNASAAASPTFTTTHGFDYNGNAYHSGNIYLDTGDSDRFIQFRYNSNNYAGASWRLLSRGSGSGDTNYFDIETGGSNASNNTWYRVIRLTMDNRYVGIGTDLPTYKLHIAGDSYTTGWSRAANGFYVEGTGVHFTHHGSLGEIDITSSNEFLWGSSSTSLYFNYRAVSRGTTVNNYIWNAGSSSSYASHTLGSLTSMGNQTLYGLTSTCNSGNSASYTQAAVQIREYNFGGAQSDTWGNAPRLAWHWSGRVQAQIGLGGNNHLYISEDGSFSTPCLILHSGNSYVTGGKGVIAGTTITQVSNADYASNADTVDNKHASTLLHLDGYYYIPGNGTNSSTKLWSKIGSITFTGAWQQCGGSLTFYEWEARRMMGELKFNIRTSSSKSTAGSTIVWMNLTDKNFKNSFIICRTGDGKYDIYFEYPTSSYNNVRFYIISQYDDGYLTWQNGSTLTSTEPTYVNERFVSSLSSWVGNADYATSAGTASTVTVNSSDSNSTYRMVWHSGNTLYGTGGIYCNPYTDYLYASSMQTSNWFRSTGNTGWYNESYGGGWYMTDSSWVRTYNGKGVVSSGFYHSNYGSSAYALTSDGGAAKIADMSVNYANSAGSVAWANVTGKSIGLVIVNKNNGTSSVYSSINFAGCLTASASGSGGTRRITVTNNSSKLVKIACSVCSVYPANSYEFGWAHFTSSPPASISANSSEIFNISFGYIHCQGNWAAKDYVQRGSGGYIFSCIAYYED